MRVDVYNRLMAMQASRRSVLQGTVASILSACSLSACSDDGPGKFVLAKNSNANSKVQILTERYENNLRSLTDYLPITVLNGWDLIRAVTGYLPNSWDLITVLKWSAYGNDIHLLGPVAAKVSSGVAIRTNEDAEVLAQFQPKSIIRISPTTYDLAKEAVVKKLNVTEFIGTPADLAAVTRVAQEEKAPINALIYLFDHYGDPWGFEFNSPAELQELVDSMDPQLVKVRGIFTHLGYLQSAPDVQVNERIKLFLRVAGPVAVKLAARLGPNDPPISLHWGASSEVSRLWNSSLERIDLPADPELRSLADVYLSNPKVRFALRLGAITFGGAEFGFPELKPIIWWTAKIAALHPIGNTNIAVINVGINDGYPRLFRPQGKWGEVSIGGTRYPLAAPPQAHKIEVDVGLNPDQKKVFPGAEVCLLCDNLTLDDVFNQVAEDTYNIAMCATGASPQFEEESMFIYDDTPYCVGPVRYVERRNIRGPHGEVQK
jgi:alanine racemase